MRGAYYNIKYSTITYYNGHIKNGTKLLNEEVTFKFAFKNSSVSLESELCTST